MPQKKLSYSPLGSPLYDLVMVAVSDPRLPRGCRGLRGWAILHKAVTAIDVDIDHALSAAANWTNTGVPLPRLLRHRRPAIRRVDVRVRSRLLVGEARRTDKKQSLALAGRQLRERHTKFLEFNPARLLRRRRKISVSAGKSSTVCCEAEGAKRLAWRTRHFSEGEQFDTDAIGG